MTVPKLEFAVLQCPFVTTLKIISGMSGRLQ